MRQVEMEEDALHGGRQGDERDGIHLAGPRFARCPRGTEAGESPRCGSEAGPRACGSIVIGVWLPVWCSVPSGRRGWAESHGVAHVIGGRGRVHGGLGIIGHGPSRSRPPWISVVRWEPGLRASGVDEGAKRWSATERAAPADCGPRIVRCST